MRNHAVRILQVHLSRFSVPLVCCTPRVCLLDYTKKVIQPAANYDVVSFARAMNDDFGPRVKKLFDPERVAALEAQRTGQSRATLNLYFCT